MCAFARFRRVDIVNEHRCKLNTCFALAVPFSPIYTVSRKTYIFEQPRYITASNLRARLFDEMSIGVKCYLNWTIDSMEFDELRVFYKIVLVFLEWDKK